MYKIYINDSPLILCSSDKLSFIRNEDKKQLIARYSTKKKSLLNYIDMMEKGDEYEEVIIYALEHKQLKKDFKSLYKIVPAAGGVVLNEENEILFIFRRGFWDLPKGKIETDEKKKVAAIREVEEETGIEGLSIVSKIGVTKHTYRSKSRKRLLKLSHWYLMSAHKQDTIPQIEEDILKAEWMNLESFYSTEKPVYSNILEILDQLQIKLAKMDSFDVTI